jgi:recombination protein RecA
MDRPSDVSAALATLQARWGAAAPRRGGELGFVVEGALARAPMPLEAPDEDEPGNAFESNPAFAPLPILAPLPAFVPLAAPGTRLAPAGPAPVGPAPVVRPRPGTPAPDVGGRIVPTGFAALDAILGTGGLPRAATVALRGGMSSGKTTVALRVAAEAQAAGAIVAWLDLARAFDPVEAVSRGVRPEWLVVLTPADLEEALVLSAALLSARTVDLLVVDLPDGRDPAVAGKRVGDRLGRLAALARRAGTLLLLLEPNALGQGLAAAVEEASGLRLELRRAGWIRLGRDVVGQRSAVTIERNRYGPPGRRADLEILYAEGGARDACLSKRDLLEGTARPAERPAPPGVFEPLDVLAPPGPSAPLGLPVSRPEAPPGSSAPPPLAPDLKGPPASADIHAPAPPALAAPAPRPRAVTPLAAGEPARERVAAGEPAGERAGKRPPRLLAVRPGRPRRTALDGRGRHRRGPSCAGAGRPPGDPARERPPAGTRGDLPRPRA